MNTRRVCWSQRRLLGFDKPWSILIDSGEFGNYVRRCSLEGNPRYVEALELHKGDTITVRLATGTRVTAPKVPVIFVVKFFDLIVSNAV